MRRRAAQGIQTRDRLWAEGWEVSGIVSPIVLMEANNAQRTEGHLLCLADGVVWVLVVVDGCLWWKLHGMEWNGTKEERLLHATVNG